LAPFARSGIISGFGMDSDAKTEGVTAASTAPEAAVRRKDLLELVDLFSMIYLV
jgi:hypothetical protein